MKIAILILSILSIANEAYGSSIIFSGGGARTISWAKEVCNRQRNQLASINDLQQMYPRAPRGIQVDGEIAAWVSTGVAVWQGGRWVVKSFDEAEGTSENVAENGFKVACISDPVGQLISGQRRGQRSAPARACNPNPEEGNFVSECDRAAEDAR